METILSKEQVDELRDDNRKLREQVRLLSKDNAVLKKQIKAQTAGQAEVRVMPKIAEALTDEDVEFLEKCNFFLAYEYS